MARPGGIFGPFCQHKTIIWQALRGRGCALRMCKNRIQLYLFRGAAAWSREVAAFAFKPYVLQYQAPCSGRYH